MDDSSEDSQQQGRQEDVNGADQISNGHCTFTYPPDHAPVVATSSRGLPRSLPSFTPGASSSKHQLAGGMDPKQQRIDLFWAEQMLEAEKANDFKNHTLPLARVKKIMKADEDVRMISTEAPVVFAKACEMLISELTMCAWMHTEESKRKTLQKNDIAAAISRNDTFDFLVDILPRDDHDQLKEETHASSIEPIPYYYLPQQHPGSSGTTVYANYQQHLQLPHSMGFMPWPDQLQEEEQQHENNEGDENNQEHHQNNEGV